MEYRTLCDQYYSILTYTYALDDAYYNLKRDIDRADMIYEKYRSIGYKSIIELSGKFVTYLELFVGLRWCLRELFGYNTKTKKITGHFRDTKLTTLLENLENKLPFIEQAWWLLRNEIHHSRMPKIRPSEGFRSTAGGGQEKIIGHLVPQPSEYPNHIDPKDVKNYFFHGEKARTFTHELDEHYFSIRSIHECCLNLLVIKSQEIHGKGIEFSI